MQVQYVEKLTDLKTIYSYLCYLQFQLQTTVKALLHFT